MHGFCRFSGAGGKDDVDAADEIRRFAAQRMEFTRSPKKPQQPLQQRHQLFGPSIQVVTMLISILNCCTYLLFDSLNKAIVLVVNLLLRAGLAAYAHVIPVVDIFARPLQRESVKRSGDVASNRWGPSYP